MAFSLHPADIAFGVAGMFLAGLFAAGIGQPLGIFAAAVIVAAVTIAARRRLWRECALLLCALCGGLLYYHAFFLVKAARISLPIGEHSSFAALIVDEPQRTDKYLVLAATAQPPFRGAFTIFAPPATEDYSYGDLVRVSGTLVRSDRPNGDPAMFSPQLAFAGAHKGFFLREWMIRLKDAILSRFRQELGADEAALLGGIVLGSRASFTAELKNAMAVSGTTHLVAVSGYNITIVILAAGALFGKFLSRRATVVLAAFCVILFLFMVGAMASAVRATIMGVIALVAREAGEPFLIRNPVAFTAAAMALADPSAITQDLGFSLSFASLLGIVYLGPPLRSLLRSGTDSLFGWKESAVTTLAAQLAVMPILVRTFGRFSLAGIGANILILAIVPVTMLFGAILAALGFLSGALAFFAAKFAGFLLGYQIFVIRLFASLAVPIPFSLDSTVAAAFYYLILGTFALSRAGHGSPHADPRIPSRP